ncbi:MAG: RnfABCDGE type electron transport complex subunit G [Synergistaceae bacterium]|jgi:electron transport complex protein RnfG|nr:RnfABCDGE type electron transport complex subunit G [Synergistaceae bacterium]
MAKILKLGVVLFVFTALTGLILGGVYTMTLEPISAAKEREKMEAFAETLPGANDFKVADYQHDQDIIKEIDEGSVKGEIVGYNITVTPKGYGGLIEMVVGVEKNGRLSGIKILTQNETPGLGANATDPAFSSQFREKDVDKVVVTKVKPTEENEVQAISGATITSRAVAEGVNTALEYWANNLKGEGNN